MMDFERALRYFERISGEKADEGWKSLLYILTSVPSLWDRLNPVIDFARAEIDLDAWDRAAGPLSHGEKILAQTALHLFNENNPGPSLTDAIAILSPSAWRIFLEALQLRRNGNLEQ